jgi:hypothetical protein
VTRVVDLKLPQLLALALPTGPPEVTYMQWRGGRRGYMNAEVMATCLEAAVVVAGWAAGVVHKGGVGTAVAVSGQQLWHQVSGNSVAGDSPRRGSGRGVGIAAATARQQPQCRGGGNSDSEIATTASGWRQHHWDDNCGGGSEGRW